MAHPQDEADSVDFSGSPESSSLALMVLDFPFDDEETTTLRWPHGVWTSVLTDDEATPASAGALEPWHPPTRPWAMMRKRRPTRGLL
jgi:hypothetical protein